MTVLNERPIIHIRQLVLLRHTFRLIDIVGPRGRHGGRFASRHPGRIDRCFRYVIVAMGFAYYMLSTV